MKQSWRLRQLTHQDLAPTADIFNHYVSTSWAAYAQHPLTLDAFRSILPSEDRTPAGSVHVVRSMTSAASMGGPSTLCGSRSIYRPTLEDVQTWFDPTGH